MKAVVRTRYGGPDVLQISDVDVPHPAAGQVLVRVHASSVNAYDWHVLRGKPYVTRVTEGLRRPTDPRLGLDVAGTVEAVGPDVSDLAPGDDVYGSRMGAFGEYVAGRNFVPIPAGLSFAEAAAVPTAGMTALQGLRDQGGVSAGFRVLILGAGGGVGTLAVQIAKALGAEVTAATRPAHLDLVRALGAATVVDYTREDVTDGRGRDRYDVVLDIAGTTPLSRLSRVAAPAGRIVMVAPGAGQWVRPLARVAGAVLRSRLGSGDYRPFVAKVNRDDLLALKAMVEAGELRPVIAATYPLERVADAIRHVERGAAGKIVVDVATSGRTRGR